MLTVFPSLLDFSLLAPLLLRVVVGIYFIRFGTSKIFSGRKEYAEIFEKCNLKPGHWYAVVIGAVEVVAGLLALVGLFTQIAALIFIAFCVLALSKAKGTHAKAIQHDTLTLLLVISIALLFLGAGFFAFDLPL